MAQWDDIRHDFYLDWDSHPIWLGARNRYRVIETRVAMEYPATLVFGHLVAKDV
jgi:hypothetical protein